MTRPGTVLSALLRLTLVMALGFTLGSCASVEPTPAPERERMLLQLESLKRRPAVYLAADPEASLKAATIEPPQLTLETKTGPAWKRAQIPPGSNPTPVARITESASRGLVIGAGDTINVQVMGRPELTTETNVAMDGRVSLPLIGAVRLGGLSPVDAAQVVAKALREGQFLLSPQVVVAVPEFQSQMVSILGEVRTPGRFPVRSRLGVLDALALSGGTSDEGAPLAYVLRPEDNQLTRYEVNLDALLQAGAGQAHFEMLPGDTLVVPKAEVFYVYGEVRSPNSFKLKPGTTVMQALASAGGLTDKGSDRRVQVRRKTADGQEQQRSIGLFDAVAPNDVLYVRERWF